MKPAFSHLPLRPVAALALVAVSAQTGAQGRKLLRKAVTKHFHERAAPRLP
jgi:hypothetical protein